MKIAQSIEPEIESWACRRFCGRVRRCGLSVGRGPLLASALYTGSYRVLLINSESYQEGLSDLFTRILDAFNQACMLVTFGGTIGTVNDRMKRSSSVHFRHEFFVHGPDLYLMSLERQRRARFAAAYGGSNPTAAD